jgi:hypothetical protein
MRTYRHAYIHTYIQIYKDKYIYTHESTTACVNQDGNPAEQLNCSLAKVIGSCDIMVTPIHEENWQTWSKGAGEIRDALTEYISEPFREYLSRGWCRLEMFFNANVPLKRELQRHKMFDGKLRQVMKAEGKRPHLLFGTRELMLEQEEPVLLRVSDVDFFKYHPGGEDAVTREQSNKNVIRGYVEELYSINGNLIPVFHLCF